jgi:hypothetical protein
MSSGIESITISHGDGSATLTGDAVDRFLTGGAVGRELVTGGDPDARAIVPVDGAFEDGDDFLEADDVDEIVVALVASDEALAHLRNASFRCLWQRVGAKAAGVRVFARAQRPGKLYRHLAAGADFFLLIGADHCRETGLTRWQLEALVYSELCSCGFDPATGKYAIRPPDFVGFVAEVDRYGLWTPGLRDAKRAIEQIPLGLS